MKRLPEDRGSRRTGSSSKREKEGDIMRSRVGRSEVVKKKKKDWLLFGSTS